MDGNQSKTPDHPFCEGCAWCEHTGLDEEWDSLCRVKPPVPSMTPTKEGRPVWPAVRSQRDYCGQYASHAYVELLRESQDAQMEQMRKLQSGIVGGTIVPSFRTEVEVFEVELET